MLGEYCGMTIENKAVTANNPEAKNNLQSTEDIK